MTVTDYVLSSKEKLLLNIPANYNYNEGVPKVFESILIQPYPLKILSIVLQNSTAFSPCKILVKHSIVTLVVTSV